MNSETAVQHLQHERHFLLNIVKDFQPEDENFRPTPEMMTVAQQIRHIALTIHWFEEGAFGGGFDMDFAKMEEECQKPWTLDEAVALLSQTYEEFIHRLQNLDDKEFLTLLPDNSIMGKVPRFAAILANNEHTAHHRGALTVYIRLLGRTPSFVYGG